MARVEANNNARQRLSFLRLRSRCFCALLDAKIADYGFCNSKGYCSRSGVTDTDGKLFSIRKCDQHMLDLHNNVLTQQIRSGIVQ